ncbi:unnamed protein product [Rotaria sp. Silwood1]|nr:unnamed protein product [Rotaria sp. Silwood1]
MLSHNISYPDKYYVPFAYIARGFIVTNVFFWVMHDKKNNQANFARQLDELLVKMDPSPIEMLADDTSGGRFFVWSEASARLAECIRLLVHNISSINGSSALDNHLSRLIRLSSIAYSMSKSTSISISLMISQITALRWCLSDSLVNCLTELDNATQVEEALANDPNVPSLLYIRSAELFAFYLLIIHRYYPTYQSTYFLNKTTVAVTAFPLFALNLYAKQNSTAPHRAVNLLGMARAYAQIGKRNEANKLYKKLLQQWSNSICSSDLDQIVIREANQYLKGSQSGIMNKGIDHWLFLFSIIFTCLSFLFYFPDCH